jgi:hypothetical protein
MACSLWVVEETEAWPAGKRSLVLVLGDQLDPLSPALEDSDAGSDLVWMGELREESEHLWSHRARTALFFSAMRHFPASTRNELSILSPELARIAPDRKQGCNIF